MLCFSPLKTFFFLKKKKKANQENISQKKFLSSPAPVRTQQCQHTSPQGSLVPQLHFSGLNLRLCYEQAGCQTHSCIHIQTHRLPSLPCARGAHLPISPPPPDTVSPVHSLPGLRFPHAPRHEGTVGHHPGPAAGT